MNTSELLPAAAETDSPSPQVIALVQLLRELADVVESLSDAQYVSQPEGSSSIGAHVRHTLDHVSALLQALKSGAIDYDDRDRGACIESDRMAAVCAFLSSADSLLSEARSLAAPLRLRAMLTGAGPVVETMTTVARELLYVQSHTIHHNAIVALLARARGANPPAGFGYAPATLAYLDRSACAPSPSSLS